MVYISDKSALDSTKYPFAHRWDSLVRKHYEKYQDLIDAQTYQIQRVQRYILSMSYPKHYGSDIIRLNLLKKKQQIGQVTQEQVNNYKNINPNIADDFNRVFSGRWRVPTIGIMIGGAVGAYTTVINSTIPTRLVLVAAPIFIDYLRTTNDIRVEERSLEFLNWVIGYRKAMSINEKYKSIFQNEENKKLLGNASLVTLGKQLIIMASS